MKQKNSLTKRERDCLFSIREKKQNDFPIRLTDIAEIMNLKPPTVTAILSRLRDKGYVKKEKGMVRLTEKGTREYNIIASNHRVLETLFYKAGIELEDACEEISNYDFLLNETDFTKLYKFIGNPIKCPHGRLINGIDGK